MERANPFRVGFIVGLCSIILLLLYLLTAHVGMHTYHLPLLRQIYPGFGLDKLGLAIGMLWGFFDGFAVGFLFVIFTQWLKG